jgi:branched-chain amino acid transport system ATP-binding protein
VLVEQDVGLAQSASGRLYCMLEGRITLTGRSTDIRREAIGEAYFGASRAVA